MKIFDEILNKIIEYNTIVIFRHEKPDGDALGSQLGFKTWINDNFASTKVYVAGKDIFDTYPYVDQINDEIIKDSLVIILDTANKERIDDQRYLLAKDIIKIDHHPLDDNYGTINYVSPINAATCEILSIIFKYYEDKGYVFSKKCAEYLYSGLLTDTLSFRTTNVTQTTLEVGSYLVSKNLEPSMIAQRMFNKSYKCFKIANYIRNNVLFEEDLAYIILDRKLLSEIPATSIEAKNQVSELGNVKEFQAWAIFTEEEYGNFSGTLRSKEIAVNKIASRFNGGGHKNASGVSKLSKEDVSRLICELKTELLTHKNNI